MDAQILLVFSIGEKGQGRLEADILDGTPDKFLGELCFKQDINFKEAAELFGGSLIYPKDMKLFTHSDQSVKAKASLWYRLSDGSFGIVVNFKSIWSGQYGGKSESFNISCITGSVNYTGKESKQYLFDLEGKFQLGNKPGRTFNADMSLSLGTGGEDVPILLELQFTNDITLPDFISLVSDSESYGSLPIPEDYTKPEQTFEVCAKLNLTQQTFLLAGKYTAKSGASASAVLSFSKKEQKYEWWVGVQMTKFSLSDISTALADVNQFLGLENVTAAVILSSAEQEIHAVAGATWIGDIGTVKEGLTFRIDVALSDGFLKDVLDIRGVCSIAGHIPADKEQEITLSGHGDTIVFLQFLTLTNIEITLKSKKQIFYFSVEGRIRLNFSDLELPEVDASISVEKNGEDRTVTLKAEVDEVECPLGIPATTLGKVSFYAISTKSVSGGVIKKSEQFCFQGGVEIGKLTVGAIIRFEQRSPVVVELTIGTDQKLSISSLVQKYFQFKWPDILDIELYNGRIWYCSKDVTLDGTLYQAGFHAQVDTKIFFLPELMFAIDIGEGKRLETSARFTHAVELAFIKFYTMVGQTEYGPSMSIKVTENESVFVFSTSVAIFSYEAGSIQISAKKKYLEGVFKFPDSLPMVGDVTFTVDDNGVSLKECQISNLKKMDFKLPEIKAGVGKCKVEILEGPKFKAVPQVKSKGISLNETKLEAKFDFILQIKSETSFSASGGDDLVKLKFTDMPLTADKSQFTNFTFDTLLDLIGDNIEGLVETAGQEIISGQIFSDIVSEEGLQNLAKFLTTAGISWVVNSLVSYLICKGLKKLLAELFVSALTSVTEVLWEGLGFLLALGGIFAAMFSGGAVLIERKAPKENEEEPEKNPDKPNAPAVSFRDEKLIIRWNACAKAKGYSPIVSRLLPDNQEQIDRINLVLDSCTDTVFEVEGSDEESLLKASYGFTYLIRIYAWNDDGAATGAESSIYLLCRPTDTQVRYQCEQKSLSFSWNAVDRALQYEVARVWHEKGEEKRETSTYGPDITEVVYDNLEPNQSVEITVKGLSENVSGPAASEMLYLYDLQAPSDIHGYDTDDGIALEWKQVPYADRYQITCQDDEGRSVSVSDSYAVQTVIDAEYLREDTCYTIRIRPMTEEIEGWISDEVKVLWKSLPVPEILELICGEDGPMVFVLMTDNVKSRQLVYPDGRAVVLDEQQISCEWDIEENARVRMLDRARTGKWSNEISVKRMRSPQDMKLSLQGKMLCVEWKETGEDTLYGIEILADSFHQVTEPFEETSWQTDVSELPEEEIIRVCLYAIDRADQRRRSNAVELSIKIG